MMLFSWWYVIWSKIILSTDISFTVFLITGGAWCTLKCQYNIKPIIIQIIMYNTHTKGTKTIDEISVDKKTVDQMSCHQQNNITSFKSI